MPDFRVYVGSDLVALGKNATSEHARSIAAGLKATYPKEAVRLKIGRNIETIELENQKSQSNPVRKPK